MATTAQFATVLQLEFTAAQGKNALPFAMNQVQAAIGVRADRDRFYAAINALSDDELTEYGAYRRANKWWNFS